MVHGEIALCILSAINLGQIKNKEELENLCDLSVRGLEELIDLQKLSSKSGRDIYKSKKKFRYRLYWS